MQPNPQFFFKAFLEFDLANFCSMLAFNSRAMGILLSEDNSKYFTEEFPVIYKNKMEKRDGSGHFFSNAIETGLKNNQIKAVSLIIEYIVKFQNSYVSAYLFYNNIILLLKKGVTLESLFRSQVFLATINFEDWPDIHTNDEESIRPYNGNYFDIRYKYSEVFPEPHLQPMTSKSYIEYFD